VSGKTFPAGATLAPTFSSRFHLSDAVGLKREKIDEAGRLFLYQAKTGNPVMLPMHADVLEALRNCDEGNPYYFWSGIGKLSMPLANWQAKLKKAFKIAGIPDAHSHRFRDSFSVDLLSKGVPMQTVAFCSGTRAYGRRSATTRHL